jgi:hypothetical protein
MCKSGIILFALARALSRSARIYLHMQEAGEELDAVAARTREICSRAD